MTARALRGLIILSAAILLFIAADAAYAAPSYMDSRSVKAGMTGYGLTVFKGTNPERFDFSVVAVTKGDSGLSDLIIIKVSGKNMELSGGIAAGMSGSPCYISDKLIGALSYVLEGPDSSYGVITPMAEMVKVLESGKLAFAPSRISVDGFGCFVYAATPIWVSGLGQRALEVLEGRLAAKGIAVTPLPAIGVGLTTVGAAEFAAGSAIAVQVSYGGIEAGALGTLTWTDGRSFLAFGHPFTNLGNVQIPMSKSEVLAVLPSNGFPFKMGTFEKPTAMVTQDRAYALAGVIGTLPSMVDVTVKATDMQTGRKKEATFKAVSDARLIGDLIGSSVLSVCDSALMRVGEGTSFVSILIEASGLRMLREDMIWSPTDVAASITGEISDMITAILENDVEDPVVSRIEVMLDVAPARLTSVLEDIELPEAGLAPGIPAKVGVRLRPFRGQPYMRYFEITLPEGSPAGDIEITVRGGASEDEREVLGILDKLGKTGGLDISGLFQRIETADQNNGLVIEIRYIDIYGQEHEYDEGMPVDGSSHAFGSQHDASGFDEGPYHSESFLLQSIIRGLVTGSSHVK